MNMWYTVKQDGKVKAVSLSLKEAGSDEYEIVGLPHLEQWQAEDWITKHEHTKKRRVRKSEKLPELPNELVLDAVSDWEK